MCDSMIVSLWSYNVIWYIWNKTKQNKTKIDRNSNLVLWIVFYCFVFNQVDFSKCYLFVRLDMAKMSWRCRHFVFFFPRRLEFVTLKKWYNISIWLAHVWKLIYSNLINYLNFQWSECFDMHCIFTVL